MKYIKNNCDKVVKLPKILKFLVYNNFMLDTGKKIKIMGV